MTSATELEIVKATKVKEKSYKQRQDFLAALVRAIDKLGQDDWDNLSDEAVAWHTAAVGQMDKKRTIEDFEPPEPVEEEDAEPAVDSTDDVVLVEPPCEVSSEPEAVADEVPEPEEEVEEKPAKKRKAKKEKLDKKIIPERYIGLTGEKDKFGITIGTKTYDAVKMYERPDGATLRQVEEAIGGRHYNILGKLAKEGHKVEKLPGGVWRVTHRDKTKEVEAIND